MRENKQVSVKKKHPILLLFILTAVLLLLSAVSLGIGAVYISPLEIVADLVGIGLPNHTFIIQEYRLPRLFIAIIAGAGLAMAGAVLRGF